MAKQSAGEKKSKNILRALMDPSRPDSVPWSSSDLRAMLEHQLATPLSSESARLAETGGISPDEVASILSGLEAATFGSLLASPNPNGKAIELVKNYAKVAMSAEGDLPRDVARILYTLAILRGRLAHHPNISSLDDSSLERETRRCLTFGWLPIPIQELLRSSSHTYFLRS